MIIFICSFYMRFCDKIAGMDTTEKNGQYRRHLDYPDVTMYQMFAQAAAQYPKAPAY